MNTTRLISLQLSREHSEDIECLLTVPALESRGENKETEVSTTGEWVCSRERPRYANLIVYVVETGSTCSS